MMKYIILFLAIIGALFLLASVIVLIAVIQGMISDAIRKKRYKYKMKHRFDKPPTAKCYCKDCKRHGEDNECFKFNGWRTADNWFCWDAFPKEKDPDEQ